MREDKQITVQAQPGNVTIDLRRTALLVIDMQNCFASKGGFFDIKGFNIARTREIIPAIKDLIDEARSAGCQVIYTGTAISPDGRETGGENSVYSDRGAPKFHREHPGTGDKLIFKGTWGVDIIDELKPREGDIVVHKSTFSAFYGTELDPILRSLGAKYLIFTGTATNICVESTLRDAYYLGYFPILVSDCCSAIGPPATQEATLWNVQTLFGWVAGAGNVLAAMRR